MSTWVAWWIITDRVDKHFLLQLTSHPLVNMDISLSVRSNERVKEIGQYLEPCILSKKKNIYCRKNNIGKIVNKQRIVSDRIPGSRCISFSTALSSSM